MTINEAIHARLTDLIVGFDPSQSLEEVLAVWDKTVWGLWLDLLRNGYDESEMLIQYAETHAWVEESKGRWAEEPRFAAQAMVAYYSLRNCLYLDLVNTDCPLSQYVRKAFGGESRMGREKRLKRTARLEREIRDLKDRRADCQAMLAALEAASTNPWETEE